MDFFHHTPVSIGVDIGERSLKLIACHNKGTFSLRDKLIISHLKEIPFAAETRATLEVRISHIATALQEMMRAIHRPVEVILGIPESQSFLITTAALHTDHELAQEVTTALAREVPLPLDALYFDFERLSGSTSQYIIGAAAKTYIDAIIHAVDTAGITVAALDFEGLASVRAVARALPRETGDRWMLIDFGATRTYCMLAEHDTILESIRLPTSGDALTRHIGETLHFTAEQAEERKRTCGLDPALCQGALKEIMLPPFELIRQRVGEMLEHAHGNNGHAVSALCLVGGGAHLPGIVEYFTDAYKLPVFLPPLFDHIQWSSTVALPPAPLRFCAALGLALRGRTV